MQRPRKALLTIGKVLVGIILGIAAMITAEIILGVGFSVLRVLFGWPEPTRTTIQLITLAILLVVLLIYQDRRRQKS